jgi:hypothetical protein
MSLEKYVEYIRNTGRTPLPVEMFDEDWEPIGPALRRQLVAAQLVDESDGALTIRSAPTP